MRPTSRYQPPQEEKHNDLKTNKTIEKYLNSPKTRNNKPSNLSHKISEIITNRVVENGG